MRSCPRYTAEFKADALSLLKRGDRSIRQLAEDLGISTWSLRDWYRADKMAGKKSKRPVQQGEPSTAAETLEQRVERLERENVRLRKENERLEEDRAILKKAAAFFAKESE